MATTTTQRRRGVNAGLAIKAPVLAATTANITLSGEQSVDGIACEDGDRVLVKNQTDAEDNGIYVVSTSTWQRDYDWDGPDDVKKGTLVYVARGDTNQGLWTIITLDPITIGETEIEMSRARFQQEFLAIACSDETSAITAAPAKVTFRAPYAMELIGLRASLNVAQTSGSIVTVDVNKNGVSILTPKLTIDNGEKTSATASTAVGIAQTEIEEDDEITIDVDQIGDGTAVGLKVYFVTLQPATGESVFTPFP